MSNLEEQFHLKFIDNKAEISLLPRLNAFLTLLYANNGRECPLVCGSTSTAIENSRVNIYVRFALATSAEEHYFEINLAGPELCELIFSKEGRDLLHSSFRSSVLGVSAVHPDWKVYFTTAYFSQSMIEGSAFARQLGSTLEEEYYPPDWFLVFVGCFVLGFGFKIFLKPEFQGNINTLQDWSKPETTSFLTKLLDKLVTKKSQRENAEILGDWNLRSSTMHSQALVYIAALRAYTAGQLALPSSSSPTINATSDVSASTDLVVAHPTSIAPSPHSEASHVLAKSYYNLMSTLIDFATSNRELLTAFTDARETSKNKMGAAGAGVVGSLVAGASSMTSFAAGEVVSASLLAPSTLAALGVPGATGSLTFLGPAIVCTNPALLGGAILAGVASLTILAVKNERRKKFNSLSDDCKKIHNFLHAAYREAWLANGLITMVHHTDADGYEFVNQASRNRWIEFVTSMGGQVTIDLSAGAVVAQLQDRADSLSSDLINVRQGIDDLVVKLKKL